MAFLADNPLYLHINKGTRVQKKLFFSHISKLIFLIFLLAEAVASPHQEDNHTPHVANSEWKHLIHFNGNCTGSEWSKGANQSETSISSQAAHGAVLNE